MTVSAAVMMGIGMVLIWGGLVASVVNAVRAGKKAGAEVTTDSSVSS